MKNSLERWLKHDEHSMTYPAAFWVVSVALEILRPRVSRVLPRLGHLATLAVAAVAVT